MSFSKRGRGSRAFTLLEVLTALLILALVAGAIGGVVRGTLGGAAALEESQSRQQQIDGLIELCRKSFLNLPAEAVLEGRIRQQDGKALPELIFRQAPQLLAWDRVRSLDVVSVLGLRPQVGGLFSLGLLRAREPGVGRDVAAASRVQDWLLLVPNLRGVTWRFYNAAAAQWTDLQPANAPRPAAVELRLSLAEEADPVRVVFWIPPLQPAVPLALSPTLPLSMMPAP